jgi:hypothetical protein
MWERNLCAGKDMSAQREVQRNKFAPPVFIKMKRSKETVKCALLGITARVWGSFHQLHARRVSTASLKVVVIWKPLVLWEHTVISLILKAVANAICVSQGRIVDHLA